MKKNREDKKIIFKVLSLFIVLVSLFLLLFIGFKYGLQNIISETRIDEISNILNTKQRISLGGYSVGIYKLFNLVLVLISIKAWFFVKKKVRNKFIRLIIPLFFISFIIKYLFTLYACAVSCSIYSFVDWLISFAGGFVRRGLSGYLILFLSDLLKTKPDTIVLAVQTFFYLGYMVLLFCLIYKKKINFLFLIILLSPATLRFPILDSAGAGRKEIILFFIFALYLLSLEKKKNYSFFSNLLFSLLIVFATFFHELIFFYTPYFMLIAYLKSKVENQVYSFWQHSLFILLPLLAMILIFLFGRDINGPIIGADLVRRGLSSEVHNGILDPYWNTYWIKENLHFLKTNNYYITYSICTFLGLIPFYFFVKYLKYQISNLKIFSTLLLLFVFSSPLFLLACDWGRWLNIHFMLMLFSTTIFLKDKDEITESEHQVTEQFTPHLFQTSRVHKLSYKTIFSVIFFCYLTMWYMPVISYESLYESIFINANISIFFNK
ncbi:hypothetical protein M0P98_01770 [bacterium]|nr:hypothetical protein [bacterium]